MTEVRKAFEAWVVTQPEGVKNQWWCRQLDDGGYSCGNVDVMWRAWKAAHALQPNADTARTLTVRELADVTAPWSRVWTDQSFGIAGAAIAKFCEVNNIKLTPKDPCPNCNPGQVCRTPACGRLKLPINHPLRNSNHEH